MDIIALYQLALLAPVLVLLGYGVLRLVQRLRDQPDSPMSCIGCAVPLLPFAYLIFYGLNHAIICFRGECPPVYPGFREYVLAGVIFIGATIVGIFPLLVMGWMFRWRSLDWLMCLAMSAGINVVILMILWWI